MLEHASGPSLHGDVTARGLTQGATARLGDLAPLRSILRRMAEGLSFPKIQSGGIRAVRQNQRNSECDEVCTDLDLVYKCAMDWTLLCNLDQLLARRFV